MTARVYSAAKATFPMRGKTQKEAWDDITAMFFEHSGAHPKYRLNGFREKLEPVTQQVKDQINLKDMFRYSTRNGTTFYVQIIDFKEHEEISYTEQYKPIKGPFVSDEKVAAEIAKNEIKLLPHPEGTIIELTCVKKGVASLKDRILGNQEASARLQYILTSSVGKRAKVELGDITITPITDLRGLDF